MFVYVRYMSVHKNYNLYVPIFAHNLFFPNEFHQNILDTYS